ncbi:hypothetical protein NE237_018189 [Protea cynaroides]|uniref:Uncharacterized protein n=1 Tax=Protea cynaroides TaxID=273540 RepID=A0A9Q0QNP8_9MAGN|nr:hypothetical protein NE237_018189 [Protea cynaroides]
MALLVSFPIEMGSWSGSTKLMAISMDNFQVILVMEFLVRTKPQSGAYVLPIVIVLVQSQALCSPCCTQEKHWQMIISPHSREGIEERGNYLLGCTEGGDSLVNDRFSA